MDAAAASERIEGRLQQVGIDGQVASAYAQLLQMGPVKASEFAEAADVSRDEAYRRLERVVEAGLGTSTLTRPLRFVALEPKQVFERLQLQCLRQAEAAMEAQAELGPVLAQMEADVAAVEHRMPFQIVNGRENVFRALHHLIDEAATQLLLANTHPHAAALAAQAGVLERMVQKADVGVDVQLILRDGAATRRHIADVAAACQVRLARPAQDVAMALIDDARLLHYARMDPSPWPTVSHDTAMVSSSPGFIDTQRLLFRLLWQDATPL